MEMLWESFFSRENALEDSSRTGLYTRRMRISARMIPKHGIWLSQCDLQNLYTGFIPFLYSSIQLSFAAVCSFLFELKLPLSKLYPSRWPRACWYEACSVNEGSAAALLTSSKAWVLKASVFGCLKACGWECCQQFKIHKPDILILKFPSCGL